MKRAVRLERSGRDFGSAEVQWEVNMTDFRGRYIHSMRGDAIGQISGTHVHKLSGAYGGCPRFC